MTKLTKLFLALALLLFSAAANAVSVTVLDPVNGGAYTLDVTLKSGTTSTYVVTLNADLGAANPLLNGATYIDQAEFKIAPSYSNVTFVSGPSGATWTSGGGALGAQGCGGTNSSFVCMDATGGISLAGGIAIGSTTSFTWQVEVTLAPGVQLDPSWHIGVHYTNSNVVCSGPKTNRTCINQSAGIVSLSGTPPIPEPTSMAVFGLGALMVGAALRRRARA